MAQTVKNGQNGGFVSLVACIFFHHSALGVRQILNTHGHSMHMVITLYTKTGIVPLRVRQFILALGYPQYL
jgi:hypothetical protein